MLSQGHLSVTDRLNYGTSMAGHIRSFGRDPCGDHLESPIYCHRFANYAFRLYTDTVGVTGGITQLDLLGVQLLMRLTNG
jgi:hypothetical protein